MKKIQEAMQDHLNGEVTTLCRCWIIETTDGEVSGYTDHDEDITVLGVFCNRLAGVEAGGIEERTGLDLNLSDISGALQTDHISSKAIDAGKYDRAKITTYIVNWSDPSEHALDRTAIVGEITRRDGYYTMELQGIAAQLDQTKGRHFVARCQVNLGDAQCGAAVVAAPFFDNGSVTEVQSDIVLVVAGLEEHKDGWFEGGRLTWTSGFNADKAIEISAHTLQGGKTLLHLWQPMPVMVSPGDTFDITAGCDKSFSTCKSKFNNHLNFRGFPHIPGNDHILSVVTKSDKFDGSPLVP